MHTFKTIVQAVLLAGIGAGLAAGIFGLLVTERSIDRAIELEDQRHQSAVLRGEESDEGHEEVFSRRTQKAGLLLGDLLYGLGAGAVFGGVYAFAATRSSAANGRLVWSLGGAAFVAVVLIPFLKYPPNPPGVGDPETLFRRQLLFVGCLLLAVAGLWAAVRLSRRLTLSLGRRPAQAAAIAFVLVWAAALLLLLPGRADPVLVPDRLLWEFRIASIGGLTLFWVVFSALIALSIQRPHQERPDFRLAP